LEGCTTGVSAYDRAATIQALADPSSTPAYFWTSGAYQSFVRSVIKECLRQCRTYGGLLLICAKLAGLYPAGALMEIMNEDGTMARLPELRVMADEYGLKLISIHDLIAYRLKGGVYR
jgi:3,4-dihydroxy 2-butanone 4-phosphate synthase/GTP cyclohydrolase II